jgi:tetratricopeptide (TPR) repeat protein
VLTAAVVLTAVASGPSYAQPQPEPRQETAATSDLSAVWTLREAGSLADAESAATTAADAARATRDTDAEATAEIALGVIRADRGDYAGGLALMLPRTRSGEGVAADVVAAANAAVARIHQLRGDAVRAGEALRRTGAGPPAASGVLPPDVVRGLVELTAGRADAAVPLLEGVLEGRTIMPGSLAAVTARVGLGRALAAQRRYGDAAETLAIAVAGARRAGHRLALSDALQTQGEVWRTMGETARADAALTEALALAREVDVPRVVAPVGYALYQSAAARGDHAASVEYLRLHSEARLRLTGEAATQRVVDVLVADATRTAADAQTTVPGLSAAASPATEARERVIRHSLLGASLSALVLAAVLWRVGYTRGRRALHYRQELEALKGAVTTVSALDGLLTICASCKDVCSETGEWTRVEDYLAARTDARFTHSVCPSCEQRVLAGAERDLDVLSVTGPGRPRGTEGLRGGFDWPPTEDELARVADTVGSDARRSSGRWS